MATNKQKIAEIKEAINDIEEGLKSPIPLPADMQADIKKDLQKLKIELSDLEEKDKEDAKKEKEQEELKKAAEEDKKKIAKAQKDAKDEEDRKAKEAADKKKIEDKKKADEEKKKKDEDAKKKADEVKQKEHDRNLKLTTGRVPAVEKVKQKRVAKKHAHTTHRTTKHKTRSAMSQGVKHFNKGRSAYNLKRDKGRLALPPGWRMGPSGPYYEDRPGHSDKYQRYKLHNGGFAFQGAAQTPEVNELMLWTDSNADLIKERDRIYKRYFDHKEIPVGAFRTLFNSAVESYGHYFKDHPEAVNAIKNMTPEQKQDYATLFANDFNDWKEDHPNGDTQAYDNDEEEIYETGATSKKVNDLILFTDLNHDLSTLRNKIFEEHLEEQGIMNTDLKPLLQAAKEAYNKEFKTDLKLSEEEENEFFVIYAMMFINSLIESDAVIYKNGGFFSASNRKAFAKSFMSKSKELAHKGKKLAGSAYEATKKGYHKTKEAAKDKIEQEKEKFVIDYLKNRANRASLTKADKSTILEARHIIVKNYMCGGPMYRAGGYLYNEGGPLFPTGATSDAVNDLVLFTNMSDELLQKKNDIYEKHGDNLAPDDLLPLLQAAKEKFKKKFRSEPQAYKHVSDMTPEQDNEYILIYMMGFENSDKNIMRQGGHMTPYQQRKMDKVFHEYGLGKLRSSSGKKVTSHKQAVAIAFSEAGIPKKREGGELGNEQKAEAIKSSVDIATIAYNNGIKASDLTLREFAHEVNKVSGMSYNIADLTLSYEAMKATGYKNGGPLTGEPEYIEEDIFYSDFKPQINHIVRADTAKSVADADITSFGGTMYETYGPEEEYIRNMANDPKTKNRVWTIIEDHDGNPHIVAGWHFINRMGYIVTEKPWKTGNEEVKEDYALGGFFSSGRSKSAIAKDKKYLNKSEPWETRYAKKNRLRRPRYMNDGGAFKDENQIKVSMYRYGEFWREIEISPKDLPKNMLLPDELENANFEIREEDKDKVFYARPSDIENEDDPEEISIKRAFAVDKNIIQKMKDGGHMGGSMETGGGVKEIRNIDGKIIWSKKSKDSFVDFAKKIYSENEGNTEKEDLPKSIRSESDAVHYLKTYTELELIKDNGGSMETVSGVGEERIGQIPSKKGDIVKIKNPNADEDPDQLYVIVQEEMERYSDDEQIDVEPLGTDLEFPGISRIEKKDLVVVVPAEKVEDAHEWFKENKMRTGGPMKSIVKPSKDMIILKSVKTAYDPKDSMTYSIFKDGKIDLENGVALDEIEVSEWWEKLSDEDANKLPETYKNQGLYLKATRTLIDKLTDIGIDLEDEEETIIAGTRLELEDSIGNTIEVDRIVHELQDDWLEDISDAKIRKRISVAIDEFRNTVPKQNEMRMGGTMKSDYWIKGSIKHKGILRAKAKNMGLIKGDEKLSGADLDKLEKLGGKWPKRVTEARTLMGLKK